MKQELGNETTRVTVDGAVYEMERTFDAPPELVWQALTDPKHIAQWWGPEGSGATVVEMDVRPGGTWRMISHHDGQDAPFKGEFLEVDPPRKVVRTEIFDVPPFNTDPSQAAHETLTLEPVDGGRRTRMVSRSVFPSEETLGGALATGMTKGAIESYDRLARLIANLAG